MTSSLDFRTLGLGLIAGLGLVGCSRQATRPGFLTDVPPMLGMQDDARLRAEAAPDLYARELEKGRGRAEAALAKAGATPPPGTYAARLRAAELAGPNNAGAVVASRPEPKARTELPLQPAPTQEPREEIESVTPPLTAPTADAESAPKEKGESSKPNRSIAARVRALVATGQANLDKVSSYRVDVSRQERVGAVLQAPEEIVFSIRRDPKAVRIEWPAGPHKGREVIYTAEDPAFMHINMADALVPLVMKMPLNSPRVVNSSRHPITEAGLDGVLANLARSADAVEQGQADADKFTLAGPETPEGLDRPCHKITRVMKDGETWVVHLDTETCWPVLVQANAANGDLLERYAFSNVNTNVTELADASAFAPEVRWKKGTGGLLGRIARSGANRADAGSANSTTR